MISLFVTALLAGKQPTLHGNGQQSRDFTYVANVVDANVCAMRCRDARGQVVNVAMGRRITLRDLLDALGRELDVPTRARRGPSRAR